LALGGRGEVEWMHKWGFVPWLVNNEWGGRRGLYILSPEKLAVIVLSRLLSELPTRGRNYQGVLVKPNSGAISVVPTPGQYYRGPGQNSLVKPYPYYRPGVGTTEKAGNLRKEEQMCTCRLGSLLTHLGHLLKHF
jgi:hypothetical protein